MRLQAPHCPVCGAPIEVALGADRAPCAYCGASLVVHDDAHRVSGRRPASQEPTSQPDDFPEPEATLVSREAPRFELSVIEQKVEGSLPEVFAGVELSQDRFALLSMRVVDADGRPVGHPLDPAFQALVASLGEDGDPGLAGSCALEALCSKPFPHRLEAAVLLFDPAQMRVTFWAAGWNGQLVWASSEEGRAVTLDAHHPALERKMLREARDYFSNSPPIYLAASDLVAVPSPGFLGRGARGYPGGIKVLIDTLNSNLGEEPLRIVTLAKNAFWPAFRKDVHHTPRPVGDVRVAAVRAILPPLVGALPGGASPETHRTRHYELSLLKGPADATRLLPLHADRAALVWLSPASGPLPDGALEKACSAVAAVLDRRDHGDNENPRAAGREALEALGVPEGAVRLAVVQLFDAYHRVKYFRAGWKQPLGLADRGRHDSAGQQFDEGGEATVKPGDRLFFPGSLSYEGQRATPKDLAEVWSGGKASRLYEALRNHWKRKKTEPALLELAKAALSDQPGAPLPGMMLVTGQ